jgi:hypothetical protein
VTISFTISVARSEESGNAWWSIPGNTGFGSMQAYNVEQSNVDMMREFVQIITTQQGFQANSKLMTTVSQTINRVVAIDVDKTEHHAWAVCINEDGTVIEYDNETCTFKSGIRELIEWIK